MEQCKLKKHEFSVKIVMKSSNPMMQSDDIIANNCPEPTPQEDFHV